MSKEDDVTDIKIVNNSGRYNLAGTLLGFDTNLGTISMDLRSALDVAYTLIDCLSLSYQENSVHDAEMAIVEFEEGRCK